MKHVAVNKVCRKLVFMSIKIMTSAVVLSYFSIEIIVTFVFLIEEGSSECIVQQTELLGYLFKLLAPHQVI